MEKKEGFLDRRYLFGYSVIEFCSYVVALMASIALIYIITAFTVGDKKINGYYLGTEKGYLVLRTDIEYCWDYSTQLNGVTFEEAVRLVNDLNKGLK